MSYLRATNAMTRAVLADRVRRASHFFSRSVGLIGRRSLEPGEGLHLVPCRAIHTFFMRTAIDAAFLDERGEVVKLFSALPPWSVTRFHRKASSVLELPAGTLERSGTRVGHRVFFECGPAGSFSARPL
jgi:uncharacterized membrane protein (UPF0127 family)